MKKTILHFIETLGTGGAERSLVENIALMPGFEHVVVILSGPEDFRDALAHSGARVINLETNKRSILGNALKLRSIIRETKPALIHTSLYYANQAGRIAGRLAGVPVLSSIVSTSYDPIRYQYEPALTPWKHNVLKMVDRATATFSQCHFMAITDCVKQSARRYTRFPAHRISVIHRGVDLGKYSSARPDRVALRAALGLADADPVLLNIGRLMPSKGQRFLIESMPNILKRHPNAHLLFAGTGYLLGELQALAQRLDVQSHVTFLGKRADIADLHAASDLFVFPSIWEGLGVSLIEAMAMGKPVVATISGPFPEIVEAGESGLLVDAGSADAIADAVIEISSSKERLAAMGERSRAIAETKFDIRKNVQQLERLYAEMITRSEITVGL